jgi:hypothetical protein
MKLVERTHSSVEELHETELEYLRMMFDGGNLVAFHVAVQYCAKHDIKHPQWLRNAFRLPSGKPPKAGRSNGIFSRYEQDRIHCDRWSAVDEVREGRNHLEREIAELRTLSGLKARRLQKELEEKLAEPGTSDEGARAYALDKWGMALAAGSTDTIKKSYEKVERAMREAEKTGQNAQVMRYHIVDAECLRIAQSTQQSKGVKVRN